MPIPTRRPDLDSRCVRIRLVGRINYASLPEMMPLLRRMEETPGLCVRIDLAGVEFLDSCGIGLLLALRKAVQDGGGSVGFENHTPRVRRILERSGIASLAMPVEPCPALPCAA